jgi:hypothetical protein
MRITMIGRNNKGEVVFDKEYQDVQQHGVGNMIADMRHAYPLALHVAMDITYPDPEVVAIKQAMKDTWKKLNVADIDTFIDALYIDFNIKERQ